MNGHANGARCLPGYRRPGSVCEQRSPVSRDLAYAVPDVLALDVYMPDFSLVPFVTDYRTSSGKQAKIVLVTTGADPATLLAVRILINGLLLKSDPLADTLPEAIRSVYQGRRFVSPRAAEIGVLLL